MTRINPGIPPSELADCHLIAEYRELPRMVAFSKKVKRIPELDFCLGTGHMKSVVRYGAYLVDRHRELIAEMRYRGFAVNMPELTISQFSDRALWYPTQTWLWLAAMTVRPRITARLATMKRPPKWTLRERPLWSLQA
jgi:hypothetical protein